MRNLFACTLLGALFLAGTAAPALALVPDPPAEGSDVATVTFEVQEIAELHVDQGASLVIQSATAGSAPDAVSDSNARWSITANGTGKVVLGSLDEDMPSGVTLTVNLAGPSGASSTGAVVLDSSEKILVSGISTVNESDLTITYGLSATSAAGVIETDTRDITFTLTDPV